MDVLVELQDGRKINIEIQVAEMKYWDRRSLFYLSKLYTRGFYRRGNYRNLKSCINVSILDFDYLKTPSCHTVFRLRDIDGNEYSDALEIHIIELQKLNKEKESYVLEKGLLESDKAEDEYEQEVKEWIAFFRCKTQEEVEQLKLRTKNPGIKEAIEELMTVNASTLLFARHEAKMKEKRDRVAREEYVLDQGIAQGTELARIGLIRKKYVKSLTVDECADMLEVNKELVQKVYLILEKDQELSDLEVYQTLNT